MTTLNHYHQESRWLFGAESFLFDFRTGEIKSPLRVVRGCAFAGLVAAMLLALAATASAQTNGTWTGADGATWNTTDTNWTGVTVPSTPWASPGTTANATFNATSGSASVSGTVFANTITYSPVGGNFSIANGTITLAGTTPTINNYDPAGTLTIASTVAGSAGLISRGAGTLVLAGNNTYTGTTTIKGGPLVLDYSGLSNTADPLSTGAVTLDMGTLVIKGKSSGSTSETISTLNMGANLGTANTLRLDANGGSGIALTTSTFVMNTTAGNVQNINLIDLSSSASNSITVGALGAGTAVTNGVIMGNSNRANLVVRDSSGYGFATLSGASIGRLSTGTTLTASNSSSTTNYRLTSAGTVTRVAALDYSTITLDSTAGAVTLDMGANDLAPNGNGRGILITGANDVSITGTGRLEGAASTWFHNYSSGTFTYGLSTAASTGASLMFGGSGLTVWTGTANKTASGDNLYLEGGIFRPTAAQNWTTSVGVMLGGVWVSSGAVLEVGADLNGATAGDLSNTIGNTAGSGHIRFWGNSGVSAFGGNRTVNFGGNFTTPTSLIWGSSSFLTDAGGTGDGNYIFKLSSNRSDSTVTVQNAITLGSLNRTVEVANGSAATDAILSGVLSGSGGLVKSGAGALTLSGNNTYSGSTTISAGTLEIGSTGRLGGGSYSPSITNNGTFIYSGANQQTLSGNISGSGALTQNASSTLILSGNNTYTGTTTINAGTLQIGAGSTTGSISSSSAITNNGTLAINRSDAITLSNTISGTGGLLKSGAGDLTLSGNNSYTGGTTLTNSVVGNLTMGANNALGNGALTFNATATARLLLNGTNQTVTGLTLLGSNASVIQNEGSSSSSLGTLTFNIADGVTSNSTSNFYFRDSSDMGANRGKLALVKTGNGTLDFSTINSANQGYSGGLTVNGGTFSYNSTAATAALGNSTAGGTITLGGGTLNYTGSTAQSISNNITLTASTTSTLNNANSTITVSGTIGGSGNITKGGAGTLILSRANAYTGDTIISAGTLQIGEGSTTGSISSSSAITNNGTLLINRSDAITLSNTISGTGNLTKLGTNTLTLSGASANTYNGTTTVSNGTLTLDKTSGVVAVGGDLVLNGSSKLLYGTSKNEQIANTASITLNGSQSVFNGSTWNSTTGTIQSNITEIIGSLTIRDGQFNTGTTSNWTVTGAGVFDGSSGDARFAAFSGTRISFNSLSLTAMNGTTIGTSEDSFVIGGNQPNATTLTVGSGGLTLNASTLSMNLGSVASGIGSRLILDGNITTTGSSASFIASYSGTNGTTSIQLSSTAGSVNRTITTGSGADLTISVAINNGNATTAGIIKDGLGTLTLSSNNTYNGVTTVAGGTLLLTGNGTLGTSTVSISGGTLDMGGKSLTNTFGSLTGGTLSNGTLTNNGGNYDLQNGTVSATLAGTNGVNKTTSGTVILTGANTYTGATTVASGTLAAATAGATGNSTVINVTGGSFLVTAGNAVSDSTNINLGGGTLAMSGNFNESVGALTLSANSTIDFSGFVGTLRFSGVGSWATGANLAIWNWSGRTQYGTDYGTYPNSSNLVFTNNATLTNNLANISFYSGSGSGFIGNGFEVTGFSGGGSEIIAVPEPETYLTGVILLLGGTIYLLRRAKHREGHPPAWPKIFDGSRQTTPGHHPAQKPPSTPSPMSEYATLKRRCAAENGSCGTMNPVSRRSREARRRIPPKK